MDIFINCYEST